MDILIVELPIGAGETNVQKISDAAYTMDPITSTVRLLDRVYNPRTRESRPLGPTVLHAVQCSVLQ